MSRSIDDLIVDAPRIDGPVPDRAAEAFAIARGESSAQPTREHLRELVQLLELRDQALRHLTRRCA